MLSIRIVERGEARLHSDRVCSEGLDFGHNFLRRPRTRGIVHHDVAPTLSELYSDGPADSTRCARHDRRLRAYVSTITV